MITHTVKKKQKKMKKQDLNSFLILFSSAPSCLVVI